MRWFFKLVEKQYLSSVDGFIFNSVTTKGVVSGIIGEGVPSIIAYPPTDRFGNPISAQDIQKRGKEPGPLKLVFLGNIIPRKGLHTLLQALHRQGFDFTLDIIGSLTADPMYAREMRQMVNDYHLSDKVIFQGHFKTHALNERLRHSHVLVVPSSYEGFGIVYLEGMAFGMPAVGTTAGAASEIIRDGQTGYLINPGDSVTLATRLQALSQDRELLTRLSQQALVRYEAQPTWERTAENIRQFLYKMVSIKNLS
jgi:glycosyltransferase involved in cell wall biosynthesis